jgi:hypothetical protein
MNAIPEVIARKKEERENLQANIVQFGGADGIRTHDLLDAIEARSQLRHGPTGLATTGLILHELRRSVHDPEI